MVLLPLACSGRRASSAGCTSAPAMSTSIQTYQDTLAAAPDNWRAWYDLDEYKALALHNDLVAGAADTLAVAEQQSGTSREVLEIYVARTRLDGGVNYSARAAFDVRVRPVYTYYTASANRSSEGRPVPVSTFRPMLAELYGHDGTLLLARWFPVEIVARDVNPEGSTLPYEESRMARVASPPRWSCLRLLADAADPSLPASFMIDIAASPNPPAIEITSPPKDQTLHPGEPVEITWSASDPDGDELTYNFSLSQDGGQRYGGHRRDLTSTSYRLDVGEIYSPGYLPGTLRFRVVASDGTRSATAESPIHPVEPKRAQPDR